MRITKVTTKTGDGGTTKLGNGKEVSKSDLRIKCIGIIDELNSFIGFAKTASTDNNNVEELINIQNQLLNLGGEVSVPNKEMELINDSAIGKLEAKLAEMNKNLPPLKEFILPGDDEFSARLHLARSVCRRTESNIVELIEKENGNNNWTVYLNRLSDYLFVLSRYRVYKNNIVEKQWDKNN